MCSFSFCFQFFVTTFMLFMEYILLQDSKNIGEWHPAFLPIVPRKGTVLDNLGGQTGHHLTVFLSLVLVKHTHSQIIFCCDGKVFCQKVQGCTAGLY